jgi:hypothetical protein
VSQATEPRSSDYPVDPDFNPLGSDCLKDPYPYFARFRHEVPVFYASRIG